MKRMIMFGLVFVLCSLVVFGNGDDYDWSYVDFSQPDNVVIAGDYFADMNNYGIYENPTFFENFDNIAESNPDLYQNMDWGAFIASDNFADFNFKTDMNWDKAASEPELHQAIANNENGALNKYKEAYLPGQDLSLHSGSENLVIFGEGIISTDIGGSVRLSDSPDAIKFVVRNDGEIRVIKPKGSSTDIRTLDEDTQAMFVLIDDGEIITEDGTEEGESIAVSDGRIRRSVETTETGESETDVQETWSIPAGSGITINELEITNEGTEDAPVYGIGDSEQDQQLEEAFATGDPIEIRNNFESITRGESEQAVFVGSDAFGAYAQDDCEGCSLSIEVLSDNPYGINVEEADNPDQAYPQDYDDHLEFVVGEGNGGGFVFNSDPEHPDGGVAIVVGDVNINNGHSETHISNGNVYDQAVIYSEDITQGSVPLEVEVYKSRGTNPYVDTNEQLAEQGKPPVDNTIHYGNDQQIDFGHPPVSHFSLMIDPYNLLEGRRELSPVGRGALNKYFREEASSEHQIDGYIPASETSQYLLQFQELNGLEPTGVPDSDTLQALIDESDVQVTTHWVDNVGKDRTDSRDPELDELVNPGTHDVISNLFLSNAKKPAIYIIAPEDDENIQNQYDASHEAYDLNIPVNYHSMTIEMEGDQSEETEANTGFFGDIDNLGTDAEVRIIGHSRYKVVNAFKTDVEEGSIFDQWYRAPESWESDEDQSQYQKLQAEHLKVHGENVDFSSMGVAIITAGEGENEYYVVESPPDEAENPLIDNAIGCSWAHSLESDTYVELLREATITGVNIEGEFVQLSNAPNIDEIPYSSSDDANPNYDVYVSNNGRIVRPFIRDPRITGLIELELQRRLDENILNQDGVYVTNIGENHMDGIQVNTLNNGHQILPSGDMGINAQNNGIAAVSYLDVIRTYGNDLASQEAGGTVNHELLNSFRDASGEYINFQDAQGNSFSPINVEIDEGNSYFNGFNFDQMSEEQIFQVGGHLHEAGILNVNCESLSEFSEISQRLRCN